MPEAYRPVLFHRDITVGELDERRARYVAPVDRNRGARVADPGMVVAPHAEPDPLQVGAVLQRDAVLSRVRVDHYVIVGIVERGRVEQERGKILGRAEPDIGLL